MTPAEAARSLADFLSSAYRFTWAQELDLQQSMNEILLLARYPTQREVILSPSCRIDFMVGVGDHIIGVEVKTQGSSNAILRQLGRYAERPDIDGLVLAATRRRILAGTPAEIHSKPVALALLAGVM